MPFFTTLASGRNFRFSQPTPDMICAEDLAFHLSRENRWSNNVEPVSFSVAQHMLVVAQACRLPQSRAYALLHDGAEMVTRDLSTPFKGFLLMLGADVPAYDRRVLNEAIYPAFGLPKPTEAIARDVHEADQIALATEFRDIVKGRNGDWAPTAKPMSTRIKWRPQPDIEAEYRKALEGAVRSFHANHAA